MWCQVLLCVQRNFLLRLRLGMTDDTALFSMFLIPGFLVACHSTASASARLIISSAAASRARCVAFQQAFNPPPASFAVSLLSPLTSSQVPAPRTSFTETPLFEVCSVKVSPRYFVLSISSAPGERGTISAGLSIPT